MKKRNRDLWIAGGISLALVIVCPTQASAAIIPLSATIDGPQANAGLGTGALGTGLASVTLDTNTNLFSWNVSWSGLTGAPTVAHFHGPALPNQNAGVQVGIGTVSPEIGATVLGAGQAADLLAGLWYVNVHTAAFPAGEIRGQLATLPVPEPSTSILLVSGLLGMLGHARRRCR